MPHEPVLLQEVLELLAPPRGGTVVDATVGGGGHAAALLAAVGESGCLVGFDRDPAAVAAARRRLAGMGGRWQVRQGSFAELADGARAAGVERADAVLFDLGLSSLALDAPERGFSFQQDGPLDMRFDPGAGRSAAELVRSAGEGDLARIFRDFGEEPGARRLARAIVRERAERPIVTTLGLARLVGRVAGRGRPAKSLARVFQALRIAVNDELEALRRGLPQALELLAPGGRVAVISFHSLEDRVVKETMRGWEGRCVCPPGLAICRCPRRAVARTLTRRPLRPSAGEVSGNPRARSARLRVAEKREGSPLER